MMLSSGLGQKESVSHRHLPTEPWVTRVGHVGLGLELLDLTEGPSFLLVPWAFPLHIAF